MPLVGVPPSRCVAGDASADLQGQGALLDGSRGLLDGDGVERPANGSFGDTLGSTGGGMGMEGLEQQGPGEVEVDLKGSPVSVVQEYDRKKKLKGDLGNGFVRFNLSPAKVREGRVKSRRPSRLNPPLQFTRDPSRAPVSSPSSESLGVLGLSGRCSV